MWAGATFSWEEKAKCMAGLRYAHRSVLSVMPTGGAGGAAVRWWKWRENELLPTASRAGAERQHVQRWKHRSAFRSSNEGRESERSLRRRVGISPSMPE